MEIVSKRQEFLFTWEKTLPSIFAKDKNPMFPQDKDKILIPLKTVFCSVEILYLIVCIMLCRSGYKSISAFNSTEWHEKLF